AGPEPQVKERVLKQELDAQKRGTMATPDIVDQELEFGGFTFVLGTVYSLAESGQKGNQDVPIAKRWMQDGARRILSEQVEYSTLQSMLAQLPATATTNQTVQSGARSWPAEASGAMEAGPMQTGTAAPAEKGVVLDYTGISGSYSSLTLYSGTTY